LIISPLAAQNVRNPRYLLLHCNIIQQL